jgi:hypothetical protein
MGRVFLFDLTTTTAVLRAMPGSREAWLNGASALDVAIFVVVIAVFVVVLGKTIDTLRSRRQRRRFGV